MALLLWQAQLDQSNLDQNHFNLCLFPLSTNVIKCSSILSKKKVLQKINIPEHSLLPPNSKPAACMQNGIQIMMCFTFMTCFSVLCEDPHLVFHIGISTPPTLMPKTCGHLALFDMTWHILTWIVHQSTFYSWLVPFEKGISHVFFPVWTNQQTNEVNFFLWSTGRSLMLIWQS